MFVRILPLVVAALIAAVPSSAHAQLRARLLAGGFNRPNGVVFDPVVPGAIYVVDQSGLVRAFLNGVERVGPFLDLRAFVSTGGEQGLLGLAFPPDAASSNRVYVHYTNTQGHSVVERFTRSVVDPMVASLASRFPLQFPTGPGGARQGFIPQPYENHNGGHLAFGPDGYLYIGLGDGGSGDDPLNNSQTPGTLLGKMLRIDVSVPASDPNGYVVPATNPMFPTMTPALPEIWAFGLRNPWRYSFDDVGSGATNGLIIADVGQGDREEIDFEPAGLGGRNYGWRVYEGTLENNRVPALGPAYLPLKDPTFEYTHAVGQAITGGFVYRGTRLGPQYQGRYFYADCVQGKIFSLGLTIDGSSGEAVAAGNTEHTTEMGGPFQCVGSFARDSAGELYFMDFGYSATNTGRVFAIVSGADAPPATPVNLNATVQGSTVTITWAAGTGAAPTGYVLEAGTSRGASNVGTFETSGAVLGAAGVPTGGYYVRVRARNANGISAATADLAIGVGCSFPGLPAQPTAAVSGSTVTLGWTAVSGTTQTILEAGISPGFATPFASIPFPAAQTGVAFGGIPRGTYYVRVRGANACGSGGASPERTVVVP